MANQQQIDAVSEQISALINKSREELVFDLHKLALEIDINTQFVNALNDLDISAISFESVDTHVSCTREVCDALIVYQIKGFPFTGRIFFLGISLLPPLAVITDTIFITILYYISFLNHT